MNYSLALLEAGIGVATTFFVMTSIGRFFLKYLHLDVQDQVSPIETWIGFSLSIVMLEFLQLFVPINYQVTFVFIFFAFLYAIVFDGRTWKSGFLKGLVFFRASAMRSIALGIIALLIVSGSLSLTGNYDSGLYHFGSIRWLNESPIVLGLANIHGRFGFNQGYFGFIALLNSFPYWNKGYGIAAPFLALLTMWSICDLPWVKFPHGWIALVGLLLITASLTVDLSSPSPDWPVSFLQIVIFATLARLCFFHDPESITIDQMRNGGLLMVLCICLMEIKLSGLIFSFGALMVPIVFWLKLLEQNRGLFIRLISLLLFALSLHLFRGFLLSGYPLYPSTLFGGPDLLWSVPLGVVRNEADWIVSMARRGGAPEGVVGNWMWFLPWVQQNWIVPWAQAFPVLRGWSVLVGGALIFLTAQLIQFFRRGGGTRQIHFFQRFAILSAASILYWFFSAPDLRFLGVVHLLFLITALWYLVSSIDFEDRRFCSWFAKVPYLAIGLLLSAIYMGLIFSNKANVQYGWHKLPNIPTVQKTSENGIIQNIPFSGESCWDSQLPCTPYFEKNLNMKIIFSFLPRPMYFISR